jgi:glycerol-3-phosphate dehydrogenase
MVGTTEVPDTGDPSKTTPSSDEIDYLIRTVAQLFPKAKLSPQDIKYAFAGLRPLPRSPRDQPSAVTRRHILHDHTADGAARMISVIGGKLTTALSLARQCARKIGIAVAEPKPISVGPGSSLDPMVDQEVLTIARAGSVSEETARGLVEWHGQRAMEIARMALVSVDMRAPICPHTSHIVAEVVEAYRREYAVSLADVLLRRVPVAFSACWSESCSREAARRIGAVLGWNDHDLGANMEDFETERTAFLCRPARSRSVLEAAAD